MRDLAIKLALSIVCLAALAACESWDEGFSPADHFFRNRFALEYAGAADFHKDGHGIFYVSVQSFNEPLSKINLKVSLPSEVKLLKGDLQWKGDLGSRSQKCLCLKVYSKKDMRDWSGSITMYVEFFYKGEKITGVKNKCSQRSRPTLWMKNGQEIDSLENIGKDEWLTDQKQENERPGLNCE